MPQPVDKTGILRIMGIIYFIGKCIPNLSAKLINICRLLNHDSEFKWPEVHEHEWKKLKKYLSCEPVLTLYNPTEG